MKRLRTLEEIREEQTYNDLKIIFFGSTLLMVMNLVNKF